MLNTVKRIIEEISDTEFAEYYSQFVMSVQDYNMEEELRFMLKYNALEVNTMGLLIQNTYERLGETYDSYRKSFADSL